MPDTRRVTVQIVTHNSAPTIDACIASLQAQTFTDFSTYVWDNASTDDTLPRVRQHEDVIPLTSADNLGYAAAHNRLLDETNSEYVLTLNPDACLHPEFLSAMVAALDAEPRAGSAAGCLLRVDQLGDRALVIDSAGVTMSRTRRQQLLGDGQPIDRFSHPLPYPFGVDGAAAFYRRAMLEDIRIMGEVFDEDFYMHKEDIDVCWRAQLRGWSCVYVPSAQADHIRSFRPGQQQRERVAAHIRFLAARNRYLLMLKNEIGAHFVRDLPAILLYDLALLAYFLLRERSSLGIYRSLWKLRGRMLAKRKLIQTGRRVSWREIVRWFA